MKDAYDPEAFRALGHRVIDRLADHLAAQERREGAVLPWATPEEMLARLPADFAERGGEDFMAWLERVLAGSILREAVR